MFYEIIVASESDRGNVSAGDQKSLTRTKHIRPLNNNNKQIKKLYVTQNNFAPQVSFFILFISHKITQQKISKHKIKFPN